MEAGEGSESGSQRGRGEKGNVRLKRKMVKALLEEALKSLSNAAGSDDDEDDDDENHTDDIHRNAAEAGEDCPRSPPSCSNRDVEQLRVLIKSRMEDPEFLEKIENAKISAQQNVPEEGTSWDMVNDSDIWEAGNGNTEQEDYVVVRQEDIVDGIACFMAAYLLSLKETKDLTPNELQKALCKTFSVKKTKGKLRKALDGSKVIYNVASWSATAIGIYQNPALLRAASTAFWTSCRVISRLF
ncbi:hypothetical protein Cgig2_029842 [Carnegiea gigantea]|uniref:Uncharacterized protein n=1 Tax=Carnegiea gigantea TaxID=171969 RepID=A0A9Q1GV27_9CARY|nr:hypothetical protein Cgig2_029842 [Carnegiea gigantea]